MVNTLILNKQKEIDRSKVKVMAWDYELTVNKLKMDVDRLQKDVKNIEDNNKTLKDELKNLGVNIDNPWKGSIEDIVNSIMTKNFIKNMEKDVYEAKKITSRLSQITRDETFETDIQSVLTLGHAITGFKRGTPWYRRILKDTRVRSELRIFIKPEHIDMMLSGVSIISHQQLMHMKNNLNMRYRLSVDKGKSNITTILWILSLIINSLNFKNNVSDIDLIENLAQMFNKIDLQLKIDKPKGVILQNPKDPPPGFYKYEE